jgi:hypothetical protein
MSNALASANSKANTIGESYARLSSSMATNFGAMVDTLDSWRKNHINIIADAIE